MTTKDLKSEIKALAAKQKATKEQRKTVKFTGTRSLTPWEAQILALRQKEELKHMYIAYALLRGKSIETAIGPKLDNEGCIRSVYTTYSQRKVDEIMAKYAEAVCVSAD